VFIVKMSKQHRALDERPTSCNKCYRKKDCNYQERNFNSGCFFYDKSSAMQRSPKSPLLGPIFKGMPKEGLEGAGFTAYLLIDHKKKDDKEWITFHDWTTTESGDTITFSIEDGKVKDWVRENRKKVGQDI